jgi:hypothetical protein
MYGLMRIVMGLNLEIRANPVKSIDTLSFDEGKNIIYTFFAKLF